MPALNDVCRFIRSKNAGPFWITIDLFFQDEAAYGRYADHPALSPEALASRLDADADDIKIIAVPSLNVVKISYPRPNPQGWKSERDMHSGQQYVSLIDLTLAAPALST